MGFSRQEYWSGLSCPPPGDLPNPGIDHSSKASVFWCSAFFTVQLSHPYMTTGETIALTRWTFVGKVKSLLFNMLSRLCSRSPKPRGSLRFLPPFEMRSSSIAPNLAVWRWRGPSGLRWVWRNGRGPHLEGRQEPQASSGFRTPIAR